MQENNNFTTWYRAHVSLKLIPENRPYVEAHGARNTFNGLWIKLKNYGRDNI